MGTKKYRPYFTLSELKILRSFCISAAITPNNSAHNLAVQSGNRLHNYLDKYIMDIEHEYRKANHTLLPSMEEKLGFISPTSDITKPLLNLQTIADQNDANRYATNQMSAAEERVYESKMFGIHAASSSDASCLPDSDDFKL